MQHCSQHPENHDDCCFKGWEGKRQGINDVAAPLPIPTIRVFRPLLIIYGPLQNNLDHISSNGGRPGSPKAAKQTRWALALTLSHSGKVGPHA